MIAVNPMRTGQPGRVGILADDTLRGSSTVSRLDAGEGRDDTVRCQWREFPQGNRTRAMAVVEAEESGVFVSFSPSLPGAASQGDTVEEAVENLREAIAGCIESYREGGERVPWVDHPDFEGEAVFRGWIDVDV